MKTTRMEWNHLATVEGSQKKRTFSTTQSGVAHSGAYWKGSSVYNVDNESYGSTKTGGLSFRDIPYARFTKK